MNKYQGFSLNQDIGVNLSNRPEQSVPSVILSHWRTRGSYPSDALRPLPAASEPRGNRAAGADEKKEVARYTRALTASPQADLLLRRPSCTCCLCPWDRRAAGTARGPGRWARPCPPLWGGAASSRRQPESPPPPRGAASSVQLPRTDHPAPSGGRSLTQGPWKEHRKVIPGPQDTAHGTRLISQAVGGSKDVRLNSGNYRTWSPRGASSLVWPSGRRV